MNKLQAMELAAGLAGLVTGMETDLIQNIAAYLLAGKIDSDISKWKIRKLAELGKLNQKNIETISSYAEGEKSLAELTVKRAVVSAMIGVETGFRRMVIEGLVNKVEPRAAPEKTKTMDVILIIMGIATLIFTIAMIWIFIVQGAIPDTLCNCFFAFVGGECGVMGWIQTNKKKYNNTEKDDEEAKG